MLKLHVLIYGRVQGVGFRYFVQRNANRLGIKGWVRNLEDGGVEVLAFGDDDKISQLLILLHQGPSGALVMKVKHTTEEVSSSPYDSFFITY
ncbi:MAG: acylphosphatase [Spirochaetia bacterium]|nr:acylphosphatase [Spirochaetota bacterium]MDW8113017.1 acylphosphatase [Spirochaetia bacterium]